MSFAVATSTPIQSAVLSTVPIVILGTDALLAAAPATPVQLAHACLRGGFTNVIPSSWGDELIASAVVDRLRDFGGAPAIQCTCPIVAHRLLSVGADLRPVMVALVPPPVAIARYLRALTAPNPVRITYVGACPGAMDSSIDVRMSPTALIELLAEREIILDEQPRVFDSVLPYDRRRHRSQPGGLPAADVLWNEAGGRALVEIGDDDLVAELAQQLFSGKSVLIDAAAALGCACSGAVDRVPMREARTRVVALEPPRSAERIVDESASPDLDLQLPASPRTPVEVLAVPRRPALRAPVPPRAKAAEIPPRPPEPPVVNPTAAARALMASAAPMARAGDGKSLPRTYVARRRNTPRSTPVVDERSVDQDAAMPQGNAEAF